ncbi:hypothetical protein BX070DRAFT_36063 [Coemansia spiralis]|nr:hypothetical protein BX070DRAFT_36063 [Coemansia spiralis]
MKLPILYLIFPLCLAGCENPATFKKCLAQTRAEVDICGINMTCKCLRQDNVIRCYEKCGEDTYYEKLQRGERGQKQIYCSQKQAGEPEDLPIIGSDGAVHKPKKVEQVKKVQEKQVVQRKPEKSEAESTEAFVRMDNGAGAKVVSGGVLGVAILYAVL